MNKNNQQKSSKAKLQKQVLDLKSQLGQVKKGNQPAVSNSTSLRATQPRFQGGENFIKVHHRELVTTIGNDTDSSWKLVKSNPDAGIVGWAINPGNTSMCPWLANLSTNWEAFDFEALRFIFKPRCSTSTDGAVQMFVDYDQLDPPPDPSTDPTAAERQASSYQGFQETPPWKETVFVCDVKSLRQGKDHRFVLPVNQAVPDAADPTNYFSGSFFVAVQGSLATFGSLWVEYICKLSTPAVQQIAAEFVPPPVSTGSWSTVLIPAGLSNLSLSPGTGLIASNIFTDFNTLAYPNAGIFYDTKSASFSIAEPGWYTLSVQMTASPYASFTWNAIWDGSDFSTTPSGKVESVALISGANFLGNWSAVVNFMITEACTLDLGDLAYTCATGPVVTSRYFLLGYMGPPDLMKAEKATRKITSKVETSGQGRLLSKVKDKVKNLKK